jgi:hypothetical protein
VHYRKGIIVQEAAIPALMNWQNFYVVIATASASLTGLMFVTITLVAGIQQRATSDAVGAFGSPTVVHFCFALFVAAILLAPWPTIWIVALLLGLAGLGGGGYVLIVLRRMIRQAHYKPVLEDWMGHVICPLVAYIALVGAGIVLPDNATAAMFVVAAVTLLLLFIGIHNAWDIVLYLAIEMNRSDKQGQD